MTSKENNPLDAICKIIIKCHALSFRTPHRMWSVCSFHHYKKYTSMVKQHITCYISSIDLPLINPWVAQERREWIKKQKVKKDLCDFVKASPDKWSGTAALGCLDDGCFFKQISQWNARWSSYKGPCDSLAAFQQEETRNTRKNDAWMTALFYFFILFYVCFYDDCGPITEVDVCNIFEVKLGLEVCALSLRRWKIAT